MTPLNLPIEHFVVRDVTSPRGTVRVVRDYWWWCINSDATKVVFYTGGKRRRGSPQCNSNRAIAERVKPPLGAATLCQIPMAFIPVEE